MACGWSKNRLEVAYIYIYIYICNLEVCLFVCMQWKIIYLDNKIDVVNIWQGDYINHTDLKILRWHKLCIRLNIMITTGQFAFSLLDYWRKKYEHKYSNLVCYEQHIRNSMNI